jgi:hypothetical protein
LNNNISQFLFVVSPCANNPCENNGTCSVDVNGNATCTCDWKNDKYAINEIWETTSAISLAVCNLKMIPYKTVISLYINILRTPTKE